jgi:hypothetical protein
MLNVPMPLAAAEKLPARTMYVLPAVTNTSKEDCSVLHQSSLQARTGPAHDPARMEIFESNVTWPHVEIVYASVVGATQLNHTSFEICCVPK